MRAKIQALQEQLDTFQRRLRELDTAILVAGREGERTAPAVTFEGLQPDLGDIGFRLVLEGRTDVRSVLRGAGLPFPPDASPDLTHAALCAAVAADPYALLEDVHFDWTAASFVWLDSRSVRHGARVVDGELLPEPEPVDPFAEIEAELNRWYDERAAEWAVELQATDEEIWH